MNLTLDQTWELCLEMWDWIVEQPGIKECQDLEEDSPVEELKYDWLKMKGYEPESIENDCWFCKYTGSSHIDKCSDCPGRLVDIDFSCMNREYNYEYCPIEFHQKLIELNKRRLA
jgi:hypothetical protein